MNAKITSSQFLWLVTLFTIGTSILIVPSGLAAEAKQDGWIAAIIGLGMGLLMVWAFGLKLGIETIARTGEIFFPWVVFLFTLLVLLLCPEIKMENIQPVLETGVKPLFRAALNLTATSHLPFIVLFMIYPSLVNNLKEAKKAFFIGTLIGGLVMIIISFLSIAILGADTTAMHQFPSFALAKKVSVGGFIERIEALIAAIWFFTIYFKMTLYFYAGVVGLAQLLKLKDYRPLLMPLGMIVMVFSLVVYPNTIYMANWDVKTWIPFSLTFGFVLPLLLLGMAKLKRNRSHQ